MEDDTKHDEMDLDEITSPLLSMVDTPLDSSSDTHQYSLSSSKKMIKPTKSINDLLNFESDSDLGEQQTMTLVKNLACFNGQFRENLKSCGVKVKLSGNKL